MARYSPIACELFREAEGPAGIELLGSRCRQCGEHYFPLQSGCARCSAEDLEVVGLGDRGVLWTWTVQQLMPKPPYRTDETPETFRPFGVGYVEMPSGVKVEARLVLEEGKPPNIGDPMELCTLPLRAGDDGEQIVAFAFRPQQTGDRS